MKMLRLFTVTFIVLLSLTSVQAETNSIKNPIDRNEQYNLRLNQVVSNECRVALFVNKNETHFIKIDFTPNSLVSFEQFLKEQDQRLKESSEKFDLNATLGGENKNHIFSLEGNGDIVVKYQLLDPSDQQYKSENALIYENVNCNNS